MKPAIRVENLSKRYRLGRRASASYQTLRETINDFVAGAWHGVRRRRNNTGKDRVKDDGFWALQDVSFEVQPGEVVGIIGRNGAGKSTLLKVLSRIVEPSTGHCEVRGRMASILEVGTGFHPELTGRENIYLNGAILGMSREEIAAKFDDIVAFAGIERFLDTPVKRYSSGMFVRLGFAVASHMQTEILIVDEVLAVGDVAFQKKCLGKMQEASSGGRTVLFVSHHMAAVRALCTRGILLEGGRVRQEGDVRSVTEAYVQSLGGLDNAVQPRALPCASAAKDLWVTAASLTSTDSDLEIEVSLHTTRRFTLVGVGYTIKTLEGTPVVIQGPGVNKVLLHDVHGSAEVTVRLADAVRLLNGGTYFLDLWVSYPGIEYIVKIDNLVRFELPERDPYGSGVPLSQRANGPLSLLATYEERRGGGDKDPLVQTALAPR